MISGHPGQSCSLELFQSTGGYLVQPVGSILGEGVEYRSVQLRREVLPIDLCQDASSPFVSTQHHEQESLFGRGVRTKVERRFGRRRNKRSRCFQSPDDLLLQRVSADSRDLVDTRKVEIARHRIGRGPEAWGR